MMLMLMAMSVAMVIRNALSITVMTKVDIPRQALVVIVCKTNSAVVVQVL